MRVEAPELGLQGEFEARDYCDLIHPESARVLATYGRDFYAGRAALTVNDFGAGQAYYLASRNESRFGSEFLTALVHKLGLQPAIEADLPAGVVAQKRVGEGREWVWVLNFSGQNQSWTTRQAGFEKFEDGEWRALESDREHTLPANDLAILRRKV